jgi:CO/xanthine dehydrogenase FAD-binding subunit
VSSSCDYLRPRTLAEALELRAEYPATSGWIVLAGGTDVLVNASHRSEPAGILDLWRLGELGGIRAAQDRFDKGAGDRIVLGAGVTWLEVQRSPLVLQHLPILAESAREIGALQIQARGTIGGNIATSSPVGDSLPVLLALEAELELASVRGARRLPYREFCTGYRKTLLAADELVTAVHIPMPGYGVLQRWRKVGTRRAQSISKVMGAAAISVESDIVQRACVALGAVADRPIRITAVERTVGQGGRGRARRDRRRHHAAHRPALQPRVPCASGGESGRPLLQLSREAPAPLYNEGTVRHE